MTSYINYFGLQEPPFSTACDINFYCKTTGHQKVLEDIIGSLNEGDSFIKITGNAGVGKTFLSQKLLASLGSNFAVHYICFSDMNAMGLYSSLAEFLGIQISGLSVSKLQSKISDSLLKLYASGKKAVLIIDEAESLADDAPFALRVLTNMTSHNAKLIQIVLFADADFNRCLYSGNFDNLLQRINKSLVIEPLSKNEVGTYLEYRLAAAGHHSGNLFTSAAKKLIFKKSGGIPRIINTLCGKALLLSYQRGIDKVDVTEIKYSLQDSCESLLAFRKSKRKYWLLESIIIFAFGFAIMIYWSVYNVVYL